MSKKEGSGGSAGDKPSTERRQLLREDVIMNSKVQDSAD
jgi:hypothetical protein